ncbi:S-adenosylmethionine-dependent methyltransferase [Dioszegia hungarica]|uniref:tRNA N(3)-methylcytidine methyltransferase n=1 Tax=Dioszegia hungarica TaxID=4972 RepID=A0AA38H8F2_9TREE|nr:S-adenosylmethionine-dependent methyltransferase [Dioszegia hungarica]KAI9636203.1 S-adenosylmethionine-dependent methyltransferase [Dioszegia hungarica]
MAAAEVTPAFINTSAEAGPSKRTAAEKWHNPEGPPVGSNFGARLLDDAQDVWSHNAWDHVELPDDFAERAEVIMERHRATPVKEEIRDDYNERPAWFWDKFYSKHKEAFFKDRAWLRLEFPELIACTEADAGQKTILEVGCGAGNTVYPLLMHNENPDLVLWATDYSAQAVGVVKSNPMYPRAEHGKGILNAAVWDITAKPSPNAMDGVDHTIPEGVHPGSVDIITAIFVLSALHPKEWVQAIHNMFTALKPGGMLLIRDYGRHDLAQLRIKKDRLLDPEIPNLYIRGDGTRVYFFTKEDLEAILSAAPRRSSASGGEEGSREKMFEVDQLGEDRRLLINRKEKLKMYRIWMQVKARKL